MNKFLGGAVALALSTCAASAAAISTAPTDGVPGEEVIFITGHIDYRDETPFLQAAQQVAARGHKLSAVLLNSEGGNIYSAQLIGNLIRSKGYVTIVRNGGECASACFSIFAAGREKYVGHGALVGVHGVSINGVANDMAAGVTLEAVRYLRNYGVSDQVLGKLASTEPNQIAWLTQADLASMGAVTLPKPSAPVPAAPAATASSAPAVALTDADKRMARRLATNFKTRFLKAGLPGLHASVIECWNGVGSRPNPLDATLYCAGLDAMTATIAEKEGFRMDFYGDKAFGPRIAQHAQRVSLGLEYSVAFVKEAATALDGEK